MRHFSWVRPALRIVGVIMIGLSLPDVVQNTYQLTGALGTIPAGSLPPGYFLAWVVWVSAAGLQMAFGLYLLFGGSYVTRLCVREVPGACRLCGYDLTALNVAVCPECGSPIPPDQRSPQPPAPPAA